MRRDYHRWFAQALGRDMEILTFGHAGQPLIVFPTSNGAFYEYEDRGMVEAIADKIEAGAVQLCCVSTVDAESFYAGGIGPRARIDRYLAYEHYLMTDVVSFVQQGSGWSTLGVTGCDFGAYHALTMALRHPDRLTTCITMGGMFDITRFLDGYGDLDSYLLSPAQFLPNLSDPWYLDRFRANKWVLATGEHDVWRGDTEEAARLLAAKGTPVSLHIWGHGTMHDWPDWQRMARAYVP
jgi:esterase/lipase superfamily enzyme